MKNIIKIEEEVQIGDILLEKGDKIEVLKENIDVAFDKFMDELLIRTYGSFEAGRKLGILLVSNLEEYLDREKDLSDFFAGLTEVLEDEGLC